MKNEEYIKIAKNIDEIVILKSLHNIDIELNEQNIRLEDLLNYIQELKNKKERLLSELSPETRLYYEIK